MIATRIVELQLLRWPGWLGGEGVWLRFMRAVNATAGITVMSSIREEFPRPSGWAGPGGMSGVVIIAESHAAIHTWPERKLIWCELATCGDPAALGEFEANVRREFAEFGEESR